MTKSQTKGMEDVTKQYIWWGVALIVIGIAPYVFPDILPSYNTTSSNIISYIIGLPTLFPLLILLGIYSLIFRKKSTLAVIGVSTILIGAYNLLFALKYQYYAFLVAGILQILIGKDTLSKYDQIKEKEVSNKRDNWFKRHPALAIILGIFIVLIVFNIFNSPDYSGNSSSNKDNYVKERLQEQGYEVIENYYSETGNKTQYWNSAWVKMKSLGDINEQVWDALSVMGVTYENATQYFVIVLTPTKECSYFIKGAVYNAWSKSVRGEKIYVNGMEIDRTTLYNYIDSQIKEETRNCS